MIIKLLTRLIVIFFILSNNILYAQTCSEYTVAHAGDDYSSLIKFREYKESKGDAATGQGRMFCQIDESQFDIDDDNKCRVVVLPFVKKTINATGKPTSNLKCVKFYIDLKNENPTDEISRIMENPTFRVNADLYSKPVDFYSTQPNLQQRKQELREKMKDKADKLTATLDSMSQYNNEEEKSKANFLDEFIDLEAINPLNFVRTKESWKSPISVELKEEKTEVNKIFKECAENTQKIPTFSLEDMLNMIKDTIFDLEGQIEKATTGLLDNVKNTIQDVVSDQAIFMYTIQALTKTIALAICKTRRLFPVSNAHLVASTMSSVSTNACKTKLNIPSKAATVENQKEDSCWGIGKIGSCFVSAFAGITFSFISTEHKSDKNAKKACEALGEAIEDETYEMCLKNEPDRVMRYILKVINLSVSGGEVEIGLVEKCNDKEVKDRYKNKNFYDKAGNPYKNRITSFLNKGVNATQNLRDKMLGYVDDALDSIRLESVVNGQPKEFTALLKAIKNNISASDLKNRYPNISVDILDKYQEKYKIFEKFQEEEGYNLNIRSAVNILTGPTLNGQAPTPYGLSNDYTEILTYSDKLLYRFVASLPAYDYYMNFFIGKDISGMYTDKTTGIDPFSGVSTPTGSPKMLREVFDFANDEFIEDIDKVSSNFSAKLEVSMMDFYEIWEDILNYLSKNFAFDYTSVNGNLTYVIPVDEIKNIIKAKFYKIYLDRYVTKLDASGNALETFNIKYIINRLGVIENLARAAGSSPTVENKILMAKYIEEYTTLILDYNLYLATYDISNPYSLVSIIDTVNINLQNYFSEMNGNEVEKVQTSFAFFMKLLNIN